MHGTSECGDLAAGEGLMEPYRAKLIAPMAMEDPISTEVARDLLEEMEHERAVIARTPSLSPVTGICTSLFGWRDSPFTGKREFHKGIDIATPPMPRPFTRPPMGWCVFSADMAASGTSWRSITERA